jgi:hypothetical protein
MITIINQKSKQCVVSVNGIEIDNCVLATNKDNTRVLDYDLKNGDIVLINDNEIVASEKDIFFNFETKQFYTK